MPVHNSAAGDAAAGPSVMGCNQQPLWDNRRRIHEHKVALEAFWMETYAEVRQI